MLYNIKEIDNDNEIDVTHITNYEKYFNTNKFTVKDIYILILDFKSYCNEKIETVYIYNQIKDMSIELNTDINELLKLFNSKFSNNDIYINV